MSLREAYIGARIIETSENYACADAPLLTQPERQQSSDYDTYSDDKDFWRRIFDNSEAVWNVEFNFYVVALSEWVARVPGLYWTSGAQQLRRLSAAAIENRSKSWITYKPWGKSQKVMGGIGTFRLPPAVDGTRLITLTTTCNASAGVPALVFPDVWDKVGQVGPCEGRLLRGYARWQPMAEGWAARFKSTRDIPRGYLVLDDPDVIVTLDDQAPTQIHPFTVMEYYSGSKELFDYVYATGDTGDRDYRGTLTEFFDAYKDKNDRYGRYLLAGDMVDALWDAEYNNPADLRRTDPTAKSQLDLLEARVHERLLGEDKIEDLLEALGSTSSSTDDLKRLSKDIGIQPAIWFLGGTLAEVCSQFIDKVKTLHKLEELVEVFAFHYPNVI